MRQDILDSLEGIMPFALMKAEDLGLLSGEVMPGVNELSGYAEDVCMKIHDGIIEALGEDIASYEGFKFYETVACYCFLTGMGAEKMWRVNRDVMLNTGIFEFLSEPMGVDGMDRYMVRITDWDTNSEVFKVFIQNANLLAGHCINEAYRCVEGFFNEDSAHNYSVMECAAMEVCKAVFNIGIAIETERLDSRMS